MNLIIWLCLVVLTTQHPRYLVSPSGYGNNNAGDVQYAAGKSPHNKPVDYTSGTGGNPPKYVKPVGENTGSYRPPHDAPTYAAILVPNYNVIGNKIDSQTLGQINTQGQQNVQKGGDQTNVGANANQVNVRQANTEGGAAGGYRPYDIPTRAALRIPNYNVTGNRIDAQTLERVNIQRQTLIQKGEDQTNVSSIATAVNVGQVNNLGETSTEPSNDVPRNRGPTIIAENKVRQHLGQYNNQGQRNYQQGGAQTNLGYNKNVVNVSQSNTQSVGGQKMYFFALLLLGVGCAFANYDTQPSGYGNNNAYEVQHMAKKSPYNKPVDYTKSNDFPSGFNFFGNKFSQQNLGQHNQQGQTNVQKGGDQKNVGVNQNEVNVGQQNKQKVRGYDAPYRPTYPGGYNPNPATNILGNNFDLQTLGQVNTQGQTSVQQGGDQTNVGSNANAVNVGQTNTQGGVSGGYKPSYDAPRPYGGYQGGYNPATNIFGNNFDLQTLGQVNTQGQQNAQIGGAQTNAGVNQNAVNVGQTNTQGGAGAGAGYRPSYDAPSYGAVLIPINPSTGGYAGGYAGAGGNVVGNKFDVQNLGQVSSQGQANLQKGGDQTNVGLNQNAVNVGQQNNQGGAGAGYKPSYDAPSYGAGAGAGYNGGPIYVPDFNNFIKNNVNSQTLGQANTQGQVNVQKGGDQTNVGSNANTVNVGQQNNQGGAGAGYKPSYDAPSYGAGAGAGYNGGPIYVPDFSNFIKNNVNSQTLGQANTQGQVNVQKGGDQTNVGSNANTVNVGQQNNQGGNGGSYGKPSYDVPRYAAILIPNYNVIGNKIDSQTLGQANTQGQTNVQKGGDQTNVGSNANAVNVGQTNAQGTVGTGPSYDEPRRGGFTAIGNRVKQQNLGQRNLQGQGSYQQGGAQGNFGFNSNVVNVSQTNNQSVNGVK
ncbi:hypothetical protein RB195_002930 [Necator americanus]